MEVVHRPRRHSDRDRLDGTFERAREYIIQSGWDANLQSDLSKYLCVLVSGFIEQAIRDIYREYSMQANRRVQAVMWSVLEQEILSPSAGNLIALAGRFDKQWGEELEDFLDDEQHKAAVNGIVDNRHKIAHGEYSGIALTKVEEWYGAVKEVVEFVEEQCKST